jgi:cobalt-zinc-cadmium efflux system membrane fusion protein
MAPAEAEKVKAGDTVRVLAHDTALGGRVIQRSHQTNERTRTVPVRIEVDNRKDLLHPGELVETRVAIGGSEKALAVPAEAVVLLQNQPTVFVAKGNGQFEPAPVVTGDTRDDWTVVKQGLKPGEAYVRKGAFALKARLLRSQLGEE